MKETNTVQSLETLADFKRAMRPGVRVKTTHHALRVVGYETKGEQSDTPERTPIYDTVNTDMGEREIASVSTVGFSVWTEKNGKLVQSYCDWPKADSIRFEGNRAIILQPDLRGLYGNMNEAAKTAPKIPVLTYELLS